MKKIMNPIRNPTKARPATAAIAIPPIAPPDIDKFLGVGVLVELGWAEMDEVAFIVVDGQCVNELFPVALKFDCIWSRASSLCTVRYSVMVVSQVRTYYNL